MGIALALALVLASLWALGGPTRPSQAEGGDDGTVAADGLPHTDVRVARGACGTDWDRPRPGTQVFDVRNASSKATEVYLKDTRTGAVYGELEGLGPGTTRPLRVDLGPGTYAFACYPDDSVPVTGHAVRVRGGRGDSGGQGGPAARPVSQHDLIPPTLSYQKWVGSRMDDLVAAVRRLRSAIDDGDLARARSAWLPAHLVYERMGAAYGAFGDADGAINGTTAGLKHGVHDNDFTGFHRLEHGLWHGESAAGLRPAAGRLEKDVTALRTSWRQTRMDPLDMGLRAHEILENTVQFELTGRTDYGSGSNLATARANVDGTRAVLSRLRPVLTGRYPGLHRLQGELHRAGALLDEQRHHGHWTPVQQLSRTRREKVNAVTSDVVERLADIAALCDVRRRSS